MQNAHFSTPEAIDFVQSSSYFEQLVSRLKSAETDSMSHYDLEEMLHEESLELFRLLLQDHLTLRSTREERHSAVLGEDGIRRTHVRQRGRSLMSRFGPVRVIRLCYSARGVSSICPMDAELNLPCEVHSHGLRRIAAEQAARGSFDDAVEQVTEHTGGRLPKRQLEQAVARASVDFNGFYQEHAHSPETHVETDDLLVLTTDAKGIVMRLEDLRPETRKRAEQARDEPDEFLRSGEKKKKNRKRMAQVASVYSVPAHPRTPEQVLRGLAPVREVVPERPRPVDKRVWASVVKDPDELIADMFDEAHQRDPQQERNWVVLVDGELKQLDRVYSEAARRDVDIFVLVDFIHVLQYLWKAANCFFERKDKQRTGWVTEKARQLLKGKASLVAAAIRRTATKRNLTEEKRKNVDKACNYILNHKHQMRYDIALQQGYPIATGVIEGACRYLVKDRMEITGARWSLRGAEAVLKIRALRANGDFERYWRYHLKKEHYWNHQIKTASLSPV